MKKTEFIKGLIGIFTFMAVIAVFSIPSYAGKRSYQKSKKTTKITPSKRKTTKKRPSARHTFKGVYYVAPPEENLRKAPSGERIGSLMRGAAVTVNKTRGNWSYITIKAWIWRPSLSRSKPKRVGELIVGDVEGLFKKKIFVIKGALKNLTKVSFDKVVLQGELFKGKRRVAFKTLRLFSKKKPLNAGKTFKFSIPFKRIKGFDRYSVRILSASEK